jgi:dihydrofolate synthase/folylpolyglutamate synthase
MEIAMKDTRKQTNIQPEMPLVRQRNYTEVVEFLDAHWSVPSEEQVVRIKKLDAALGNQSKKIKTVAVTGTNGKSITIHLASKLLKEENLKVGAMYAPHILTYNERLAINEETISNKEFTEIANTVINAAETMNLNCNSFEIITMMAIVYFANSSVDVALFETGSNRYMELMNICSPVIVAVTRAIDEKIADKTVVPSELIKTMLSIVREGTHVISADQSKLNLQLMLDITESQKGIWTMPIRKLAQLSYPYEQLHGRCAALAERIADIFVNTFANRNAIVVTDTLLTKLKGQRGRPTLEAKRQAELNPRKTVDQFWKETVNTLPGRFQLLDKEKPSLLLDNASNLDAITNLLLGVRLLHYQRPLKGLTVILGCNNKDISIDGLTRALRYFFKKTSGQVVLCPVTNMPSDCSTASLDIEKIANDLKGMKLKARACSSFIEAFDIAQKSVDERNGLVVITGSSAIIHEYWNYKGIKKIV